MVGADLWSPAVVGVTFYNIESIECNKQNHSEARFLGKTSAEIVNEFGQFDCTLMPSDEDGLYRNCGCGYRIKEPQVGFFGTSPEILFFIYFYFHYHTTYYYKYIIFFL